MFTLPRPSLAPLLLLGLFACAGQATTSPTTVAATPPVTGRDAGGGALTADELNGACRERVEGASSPGECTADSGCAKAGCSQEVCVPVKAVAEIQTTCERLPCFTMLDTCGCHEGMCTWTLKEGGPPLMHLPALDPASGASTTGTPGAATTGATAPASTVPAPTATTPAPTAAPATAPAPGAASP